MKSIAEVKNAAHKVLFKFQTGAYDREDVYCDALNLVVRFNQLVSEYPYDEEEAQDVASLLMVLKRFSK